MVCHYLAKFGGHRYCSSRDMFLVFHVIKQGHVIIGSSYCNDRSPLGLVVISTVVVKI